MSNDLSTSVFLTLQKKQAIMHALAELLEEKHSAAPGLLKRLKYATDNGIAGLELSGKEIHDTVSALELALKKTRDSKAERYGFFSVTELEKLLGDFYELLKKF